jgi:hypothetical protein
MATGAEATERVAEATGLLPSTVFRTARLLREAEKGLWPEAAKGGGKGAAHVERRHLANLAIALAVNDPLLAVKAIPAYRAVVPHKPDQHGTVAPKDRGVVWSLLTTNGMFNGRDPLGVELERLIELLTRGDIARDLENAGAYTEFFFDRLPRASFVYRTFDDEDDMDVPEIKLLYRKPNISPSLSRELDLYRDLFPQRSIPRTAIIFVSVFTAMAELWSDTKQHQHQTPAPRQHRRSAVLIKE